MTTEGWFSTSPPKAKCDQDEWAFADSLEIFEVRQAVAQIFKTTVAPVAHLQELQALGPEIGALHTAHKLREALEVVISDLVEQARERHVPWEAIGQVLGGVQASAVQNKYGQRRRDQEAAEERAEDVRFESLAARFGARLASGEEPTEDLDEFLEEISNESYADRFAAMRNLVDHAHRVCEQITAQFAQEMNDLQAAQDPDLSSALGWYPARVNAVHQTMINIWVEVNNDSQMWVELGRLGNDARRITGTMLHDPVKYTFYALTKAMYASSCCTRAWNALASDEGDVLDSFRYLQKVRLSLSEIQLIMDREDVKALIRALPSEPPGSSST
ncbi:hypothetical protein [Actinomadura parmotrematis]|uniref:Uncharacterized protein n=1 Tax=Actinomadura parmotrematis TaxID=2864039 RepID=A0ABS7FSB7_9ACTN|nr:hypothetical protein [Actinomadura parmotrematis]MBW8482619.1 hypothetical protein [Actinomadura parmotrematis]